LFGIGELFGLELVDRFQQPQTPSANESNTLLFSAPRVTNPRSKERHQGSSVPNTFSTVPVRSGRKFFSPSTSPEAS
jgi:hypothetical protein